MALLDKETLEKLGHRLILLRNVLTIVGILFPLIYLSGLLLADIGEDTIISDKALLPGLVDETWHNQGELGNHVKALTDLKEYSGSNKKRGDYIFDELSKIGVETYRQKFKSNITKISGTNVYGFVRTSRATSAEAMILVVKMGRDQKHAISVALSIARHSKSKSYWARDLIFLFVDGLDPKVATLAWLQSYNGIDTGRYLWAEPLQAHSGTIMGGIVLDLTVPQFTHFQLQYIGVNGLLPNLDVFNLFVRLCEKHDVKVQIQSQKFDWNDNKGLKALWRGAFSQAFNELEGIHSILNHYRIHSVNLKALPQRHPHKRVKEMDAAALILEGGLRSYNNMLEKFHRSYFFYYLFDPHRFLSIAYYFPAIGAQIIVMILNQFQAWSDSTTLKSHISSWVQANIVAAIMYFSHIFVFNQYLQVGSAIHSQLAYWSNEQLAALVLSLNLYWPWIASSKIKTKTEHATVRYIHYGFLTVVLLSAGLLNHSIAIYLGTYLLLSSFITSSIRWNNFLTRFLYNLIMNPITFHLFVMILASELDLWPEDLKGVELRDLSNPAKIATTLLSEGRRLLGSHLQHNAFNFLLFMLVSQQAHTVFIGLLGSPKQ